MEQNMEIRKPTQYPQHLGHSRLSPKTRQLKHLSTLDDILGGKQREEIVTGLSEADLLLQSILNRGVASTTLSQDLRDKEVAMATLKSRMHAAESKEIAMKAEVAKLSEDVEKLKSSLEAAKADNEILQLKVQEQQHELRSSRLAQRKHEKTNKKLLDEQALLRKTLEDMADHQYETEQGVEDILIQDAESMRLTEDLEDLRATVKHQKREIANYEQFAQQAKRECMLLTTKVVEIVRKNDALTQALEAERSTLKTVADRFCHEQIASEALKTQLRAANTALAEEKTRYASLARTVQEQTNYLGEMRCESWKPSSISQTSVGVQVEGGCWFSEKQKNADEDANILRIAKALVHSYTEAGMLSAVTYSCRRAKTTYLFQQIVRESCLEGKDLAMDKLNDRVSNATERLERLGTQVQTFLKINSDIMKRSTIEKAHMESMIKSLYLREADSEAMRLKQAKEIESLTEQISELHRTSTARHNQLQDDLKERDLELAEYRRKKQREEAHLMTFKEEIGQEIGQWQQRADMLQSTIRQLTNNLGSISNKQKEALVDVEEEKTRLKQEMVAILECMEFMYEDQADYHGSLVKAYLDEPSATKDLVQLHASIASLKVLERKAELVHLQKQLELSRESEHQQREKAQILSSSLQAIERQILAVDPEIVEVQRSLRSSRLKIIARRLKELRQRNQDLQQNTSGNRERLHVLIAEAEGAIKSRSSMRKKKKSKAGRVTCPSHSAPRIHSAH